MASNWVRYKDPVPKRVRLLILGGGIHGLGLAHDMATRGWQDVYVVEKNVIGSGTSSRSTKLIHGGLRYLKHLSDFPLVRTALHERDVLARVASDLVHPMEFVIPILQDNGIPAWMVKSGLKLYDMLAGRQNIAPHRLVKKTELAQLVPPLRQDLVSKAYSYWDMQTDDLSLVRLVAASAHRLGAKICEQLAATRIQPEGDGFRVFLQSSADGKNYEVSARYVYNALGSWSDHLLQASGLSHSIQGVNSKGVHLIFKDLGLRAGMFLQSVKDDRIFFVLPWQGYTLVGTTETLYQGIPDDVQTSEEDIDYLLQQCQFYLKGDFSKSTLISCFAGLRWLPVVSPGQDLRLGQISRRDEICELQSGPGILYTLYGGKLSTYRSLSQQIGDKIANHFGEARESATNDPRNWLSWSDVLSYEDHVLQRFAPGGIAYSCAWAH